MRPTSGLAREWVETPSLVRRRSAAQVEFPFCDSSPILQREAIRKAGIRTFEELENWLRTHQPKTLELGARCPKAQRQTGYLLERDWKPHPWGTHYWEGCAIREQTDTRLVAEFSNAWSPAIGIYHEMAHRFPSLAIPVSAIILPALIVRGADH